MNCKQRVEPIKDFSYGKFFGLLILGIILLVPFVVVLPNFSKALFIADVITMLPIPSIPYMAEATEQGQKLFSVLLVWGVVLFTLPWGSYLLHYFAKDKRCPMCHGDYIGSALIDDYPIVVYRLSQHGMSWFVFCAEDIWTYNRGPCLLCFLRHHQFPLPVFLGHHSHCKYISASQIPTTGVLACVHMHQEKNGKRFCVPLMNGFRRFFNKS